MGGLLRIETLLPSRGDGIGGNWSPKVSLASSVPHPLLNPTAGAMVLFNSETQVQKQCRSRHKLIEPRIFPRVELTQILMLIP